MPRLRIEITPSPQYPNHKVAVSPHDTATFSFPPLPPSSSIPLPIPIPIHPTPTKKSPTKVQIRTPPPTFTPYLCTNKPEREQTGARASCPRTTTTPPTTLKSLPSLTSLKSYHVHRHRLQIPTHQKEGKMPSLRPPPQSRSKGFQPSYKKSPHPHRSEGILPSY